MDFKREMIFKNINKQSQKASQYPTSRYIGYIYMISQLLGDFVSVKFCLSAPLPSVCTTL